MEQKLMGGKVMSNAHNGLGDKEQAALDWFVKDLAEKRQELGISPGSEKTMKEVYSGEGVLRGIVQMHQEHLQEKHRIGSKPGRSIDQ